MFVIYKNAKKICVQKTKRRFFSTSNRVMRNLDTAAATHDYVVSPRIRTKSKLGNTDTYKLTGGACGACGGHKHTEGFRGCGATAPTQTGGARRRSNKSGKSSGKNRKTSRKSSGKNRKTSRKSSGKNRKTRKTRKQRGGQENIPPREQNPTAGNKNKNGKPNQGEEDPNIQEPQQNPPAEEQNLPEEIQLIQGSSNQIYRGNSSNQGGGGSAWMASQYSQSLSPSSHARSSQFSSSAPTVEIL